MKGYFGHDNAAYTLLLVTHKDGARIKVYLYFVDAPTSHFEVKVLLCLGYKSRKCIYSVLPPKVVYRGVQWFSCYLVQECRNHLK